MGHGGVERENGIVRPIEGIVEAIRGSAEKPGGAGRSCRELDGQSGEEMGALLQSVSRGALPGKLRGVAGYEYMGSDQAAENTSGGRQQRKNRRAQRSDSVEPVAAQVGDGVCAGERKAIVYGRNLVRRSGRSDRSVGAGGENPEPR